MKNTFVVEVESREGTSAKALAEAFDRGWNLGAQWQRRPAFKVEEYDYKKIIGFVSDYMAAVDALSEFEHKHDGYGKLPLDSSVGRAWKRLYDDVQLKRKTLAGKLRDHGCVV